MAADPIVGALVTEDLARLAGKTPPPAQTAAVSKSFGRFPERRARIAALLRTFGLDDRDRHGLALEILPALVAALLATEAEAAPPPEAWRRRMHELVNTYLDAAEPFSLNLMNLGLNLAQAPLFRSREYPPGTIELGGGNGYVSAVLLGEARARVTTTDLLPSACLDARRRGFARVAGVDMHRLPFADGSVPALVSIHSVDNAGERERTLREAFRVLRPGGTFVFSDLLPHFHAARPLPRVLRALGAGHLADEYAHFVVAYSIDSADTRSLDLPAYGALLSEIGFAVDVERRFFGGALFDLSFLAFDLLLLLRDEATWGRHLVRRSTRVWSVYREIIETAILPLIYGDAARQADDQTQVFWAVRKPGRAAGHDDHPAYVCPSCRGPLAAARDALQCPACGPYPIVGGVPLLYPDAAQALEAVRLLPRGPLATAKHVARRLARAVLR